MTLEGRVIGVLLRAYAVAIFGYIAGSIASYLVGQRVAESDGRRQRREELDRLVEDMGELNATIDRLLTERQQQNRSGH